MANTTLHWSLRQALPYLRDDGRLAVLVAYILHANQRNRAWPSVETLIAETGYGRNSVIEAKKWLVEVGALEAVPAERRTGDDELALHPRSDLFQITGLLRIEGEVIPFLHFNEEKNESINGLLSKPLNGNSLLSKRLPTKRLPSKPEGISIPSYEDISSSSSAAFFETPTEIPTVFRLMETLWGQMVSGPYEAEQWNTLVEEYPIDWIEDAMKEAVDCGGGTKRSIRYVQKVLARWKQDGRASGKQPDPAPAAASPATHRPSILDEPEVTAEERAAAVRAMEESRAKFQ